MVSDKTEYTVGKLTKLTRQTNPCLYLDDTMLLRARRLHSRIQSWIAGRVVCRQPPDYIGVGRTQSLSAPGQWRFHAYQTSPAVGVHAETPHGEERAIHATK